MMSADLILLIIAPVYNERRTLSHIVRWVMLALPGTPKQIIVVDDCSTDGSHDWLLRTFPQSEVAVVGIGRDQSVEPLFFHADEQYPRTDRPARGSIAAPA